MRIIVVGTGAVGGVVAANLVLTGVPVVAIARGEHARVMREEGLLFESPTRSERVALPVATSVSEVEFAAGDVVVLSVKSQGTAAILDELRGVAPSDVPIVCMQNGVDNERQALRLFPNVYGMCVMLPADHLVPGAARVYTSPTSGLLDIGRYPSGSDQLCVDLADALETATFSSIVRDDIMRWKYRKLTLNLVNAVEAVCGRGARHGELSEIVQAEGDAVLAAAGISVVSLDEDRARRGELLTMAAVAGEVRRGGSSWQSLQRGTGTIETDALTGEIVLLGRLHGVATPANVRVQHLAAQMATSGASPGEVSEAEVLASLRID